MGSPVITIKKGVKMKKQNKKKIGVRSVVKAKVGDLEKIKRERRIRRMIKEVVGCFRAVTRKHNFLVQIKYGQKKEIGSY